MRKKEEPNFRIPTKVRVTNKSTIQKIQFCFHQLRASLGVIPSGHIQTLLKVSRTKCPEIAF
jgi:hypothetical protein